MKQCTYCGKEYSDEVSVCVIDGEPLQDVGRHEKTHERHSQSDKILKKETALSKWLKRSALQAIDLFCDLYFLRGVRSRDEPFRKATETEKRVGASFMALWPLLLAFMMSRTESFGEMVDSMIYGRRWMGWFYLGFIALVGGGIFFAVKIAPKIPLFVSIPIAIVSWLMLIFVLCAHHLI